MRRRRLPLSVVWVLRLPEAFLPCGLEHPHPAAEQKQGIVIQQAFNGNTIQLRRLLHVPDWIVVPAVFLIVRAGSPIVSGPASRFALKHGLLISVPSELVRDLRHFRWNGEPQIEYLRISEFSRCQQRKVRDDQRVFFISSDILCVISDILRIMTNRRPPKRQNACHFPSRGAGSSASGPVCSAVRGSHWKSPWPRR